MPGRYLIRLDDIAPNMCWEQFTRLLRLFDEYAIKPLVGVIPDNRDQELLQFPKFAGDFWAEVLSWEARGWEISQHGFQHVYATAECGLFGINGLSEFAGLPFDEHGNATDQSSPFLQCNLFAVPQEVVTAHGGEGLIQYERNQRECRDSEDEAVVTGG